MDKRQKNIPLDGTLDKPKCDTFPHRGKDQGCGDDHDTRPFHKRSNGDYISKNPYPNQYKSPTVQDPLLTETLPSSSSAQSAGLCVVTAACKWAAGPSVAIYTGSKYAHNDAHTAQGHLRGFKTSKGTPVKHTNLLKRAL